MGVAYEWLNVAKNVDMSKKSAVSKKSVSKSGYSWLKLM